MRITEKILLFLVLAWIGFHLASIDTVLKIFTKRYLNVHQHRGTGVETLHDLE